MSLNKNKNYNLSFVNIYLENKGLRVKGFKDSWVKKVKLRN
jgi:hypothetical protein